MTYHHGNLREALLDRAAEVIAAEGVAALSLRALSRDLGVSHAAPRNHFADKKALLSELARRGFERSVEVMRAGAEAAGDDPLARYRALGRSYVQFAREQPSYFRAMNHPEVRAHQDPALKAARAEFNDALREGVEQARSAGWHPEADVSVLLVFSCAAAMGAAEILSDPSMSQLVGAEDPDTVADAVLDLVVHRTRARDQASEPARAASAPSRSERPN